jgi:ubiquinone/menaquinone biosynthesis methyltransferase
MADRRIYDPLFVRDLFDEMSATYGAMNLVTSFGFAHRWRRQCVAAAKIQAGERVLDLMTGMGELLSDVTRRVGKDGTVAAVDISPRMCERARRYESRPGHAPVRIIEADALLGNKDLPDGAYDLVVSTFGLKTFSPEQIRILAGRISMALRPGGRFSILEISVPPSWWLRVPYLFYLRRVIPLLGKLFMGNPDNYRMLGIYTTAFENCDDASLAFVEAGFQVEKRSYFFGCASGLIGRKVEQARMEMTRLDEHELASRETDARGTAGR